MLKRGFSISAVSPVREAELASVQTTSLGCGLGLTLKDIVPDITMINPPQATPTVAQFHGYQTLSWHSVNTRDYDEDEYS